MVIRGYKNQQRNNKKYTQQKSNQYEKTRADAECGRQIATKNRDSKPAPSCQHLTNYAANEC